MAITYLQEEEDQESRVTYLEPEKLDPRAILSVPRTDMEDEETYHRNIMKLYYENETGREIPYSMLGTMRDQDFGEGQTFTNAVFSLRDDYNVHSQGGAPIQMMHRPKEDLTVGDWLRSFSGHTSRMVYGTVSGLARMTAGLARHAGFGNSDFYYTMNLAADDMNLRGDDLYRTMADKGFFKKDISDTAANDIMAQNVGQLLMTVPVLAAGGVAGASAIIKSLGIAHAGSVNMGMLYNEGYTSAVANGKTDSEAHDIAGIYTMAAAPPEVLVDMLTAGMFKPFTKIVGQISKPVLKVMAKTATQSMSAALAGGPTEGGQYALLQKLMGEEINPAEFWANVKAGALIEALGGSVVSVASEIDAIKAESKIAKDLTPIIGEEKAVEAANRIVNANKAEEEVFNIVNEIVAEELETIHDAENLTPEQKIERTEAEVHAKDVAQQQLDEFEKTEQLTPVLTEPMTEAQAKRFGTDLTENDINFLYEASPQRELFKRAVVDGDEVARKQFNQNIVGPDPAIPLEAQQEILPFTKPEIPQSLLFEPMSAEEFTLRDQALIQEGSLEFETDFGEITPNLSNDDVEALFEKTYYDQIKDIKTEDQTLEQIQFLESYDTTPIILSEQAQAFYDKWQEILPSLTKRLKTAADTLGIDVGDRGDLFFHLSKDPSLMTSDEQFNEWMSEERGLKFGATFARKKGVDQAVYNRDAVAVAKEYVIGLQRMEKAAQIKRNADGVNLTHLANALETIKDAEGKQLTPSQSKKFDNALKTVQRTREILREAKANRVTTNLSEIDELKVAAILDYQAREHNDHKLITKGIGDAVQIFDAIKVGKGRSAKGEMRNKMGPTTKVIYNTLEQLWSYNDAQFIETARLEQIYRDNGFNHEDRAGNRRLYELTQKYSIEEIRGRPVEEFGSEEQSDIGFIKQIIEFTDGLIGRHSVDLHARYELNRSDKAFWVKEVGRSPVDNLFDQTYVHLTKTLKHAYLSSAVRGVRLLQTALKTAPRTSGHKGYPKFVAYLDKWIGEGLAGDMSAIDQSVNMQQGGKIQRSLRFWQRTRNKAHLVGNPGFFLSTQGSSYSLAMSYGFFPAIRSLLSAISPSGLNLFEKGSLSKEEIAELPARNIKVTDLEGAVMTGTEYKDVISGSKGHIKSAITAINKTMTKPNQAYERFLTDASIQTVYQSVRKLGMSHEDAKIYADLNGPATQSNYNKEMRPLVMNSDFVKSLWAHQSFGVTLWNHIESIVGNNGIPLTTRERVARGVRLLIAAQAFSELLYRVTGRRYFTPGSAIPFVGKKIDTTIEKGLAKITPKDSKARSFLVKQGYLNRFSALPEKNANDLERDASDIMRAIDDFVGEHRNPKRFYKWMAQYGTAMFGLGGGVEYSRLIDVMTTIANDGEVKSVSGKTLFELENEDYIKAIIFGIYSTKPGKQYMRGEKTERAEKSMGGVGRIRLID